MVRKHLGRLQREAAAGGNVVTEGRDQGSAVFPNAECKIFLTADPGERARRRLHDLGDQGETKGLEDVLADINRRDREDVARAVGPLVRPDDAVEVRTDNLNEQQVVDRLESIVRGRHRSSP